MTKETKERLKEENIKVVETKVTENTFEIETGDTPFVFESIFQFSEFPNFSSGY